jgi:hypothetical protein
VKSANPAAVKKALKELITTGSVEETDGGFSVGAEMKGESAKDLNRSLLSALRRVEKRTTLRAEWTSDNGDTERYFDYALKKRSVAAAAAKEEDGRSR